MAGEELHADITSLRSPERMMDTWVEAAPESGRGMKEDNQKGYEAEEFPSGEEEEEDQEGQGFPSDEEEDSEEEEEGEEVKAEDVAGADEASKTTKQGEGGQCRRRK